MFNKYTWIFVLAAYTAMEIDENATMVEYNTWSLRNIAWGLLGLFALFIMIFGLIWKCIVSPVLDLTWNTVTAGLWIVAISVGMSVFTLMLCFIT